MKVLARLIQASLFLLIIVGTTYGIKGNVNITFTGVNGYIEVPSGNIQPRGTIGIGIKGTGGYWHRNITGAVTVGLDWVIINDFEVGIAHDFYEESLTVAPLIVSAKTKLESLIFGGWLEIPIREGGKFFITPYIGLSDTAPGGAFSYTLGVGFRFNSGDPWVAFIAIQKQLLIRNLFLVAEFLNTPYSIDPQPPFSTQNRGIFNIGLTLTEILNILSVNFAFTDILDDNRGISLSANIFFKAY